MKDLHINFLSNEGKKVVKYRKRIEQELEQKRTIDYHFAFVLNLLFDLQYSLKSMRSLIKNESYYGMEAIARSIFERYLYISHVGRKKEYAEAYFISIELRRIKLYEDIINNNREVLSMFGPNENPILFLALYLQHCSYCGDEDKTQQIKERYKSFFFETDPTISFNTNNQLMTRKWYAYKKNISNLKDLARDLNMIGEYMRSYSSFSGQSHGFIQNENIKIDLDIGLIALKHVDKYDLASMNMYTTYFLGCIHAIEAIMKTNFEI